MLAIGDTEPLTKLAKSIRKSTIPPTTPQNSSSASRISMLESSLSPSKLSQLSSDFEGLDNVEPFSCCIMVIGGSKVAILPKPCVRVQATGEYLSAGITVDVVARTMCKADGRVYLKLKSNLGWVPTRSRKDLSKVVLGPAGGDQQLEPPMYKFSLESPATQVLPAMDAEGKFVATSTRSAKTFRVLVPKAPVLKEPSGKSTSVRAPLVHRSEILVDGVHFVPQEHRAYLHLQDGRGWVCERLRADFCRFALEPNDMALDYGVLPDPPQTHSPASNKRKFQAAESGVRSSVDASSPSAASTLPVEEKPRTHYVFRSDKELWPASMQPPRPITSEARKKLRRLYNHYGSRVREASRDILDVDRMLDTYQRSCPAKKALEDQKSSLQAELKKDQQQWVQLAAETLKAMPTPPSGSQAMDSVADFKKGTTMAVQVCGERWYCARLTASGNKEGGKGAAPVSRYNGPLRRCAAESLGDLRRMRCAQLSRM